jgi:CheY-like chemotaxis protein
MRLEGIRVMAVEDDDDGRYLLTLMLELAGAKVVPAASVREALAAFETTRPDVIVSDIAMPGQDGYALIRHVRALEREHGSATPAIALTGFVRPEDRARMLAAGFQAHLRKPVDPDELVAVVASLAAISSG